MADPGISNGGGGVRITGQVSGLFWCPVTHTLCFVAIEINYKLYNNCVLTTIKVHVYAYYTVKIHKNKTFFFQTICHPPFALPTFGSWYRDAVLDTVRLTADKIKGCKSLRLDNHLPIVHPNVYQPQVRLQTSRYFSCFWRRRTKICLIGYYNFSWYMYLDCIMNASYP